ncbi:hypothetical protein RM543_18645 [Roseicyclus sp. F158]|uniref:Uncharacterized protein n=1 Tax=Tropicimonas omnivorans TaxID=3075590 RepID=A0ABU3DLV5_9RHOB|nr:MULTISPECIES: hypothetical protein [Roseobacteraceae]MDT0684685.1 hypothetical protein [Roseicyclus sp. F158]
MLRNIILAIIAIIVILVILFFWGVFEAADEVGEAVTTDEAEISEPLDEDGDGAVELEPAN